MSQVTKAMLFPLALLAFIAAIYVVRTFDKNQTTDARSELHCPPGQVLVMDTSRNFLCLPGSVPVQT